MVDDEPSVRDALRLLFRSVGLAVSVFAGPDELLAAAPPPGPCCLVSDLRMPGMSGIELFDALRSRGTAMPTVILTGHGDVPHAVRAMKAGVLDFILKPFDDQDLIDAVQRALRGPAAGAAARAPAQADERLALLSGREREVLKRMVDGRPNKLIARELGVSTRTVEAHRARVMEKLAVRSLAEAVRLALCNGFADPPA